MSFAGLGVLEIGLCISFLLFGVVISQSVIYFRRYSRDDPGFLNCLVSFVLILELAHSAVIIGMIYSISITFSHLTIIPQNSYFLATTNVLENLLSLVVQSFFSYRVFRLSKRFSLGLLCWALSTLRFACGVAVAVESYIDVPRVPNGIVLITKFGWLITLAFVLGGLVDVVIAALQVWYLRDVVKGLQDMR
ncbi:hypothetical protein P691DRAFT_830186 [Macrolepiota fuliginosa MF-IS2]|uniref:Uncharacterized protein n=1 Tax=Macrolepiota fuliginosa MF-IS2 TaxID=1400762 RepID=A0A9P5X7B6_9AGAR|nr:hypothetical protein P691DRAFT_830186 [Macrolepiota fuliginosa MF-IS2]